MAQKKYTVREGFVVALTVAREDGSTFTRTFAGGESCTLDDADAALHLHKLQEKPVSAKDPAKDPA